MLGKEEISVSIVDRLLVEQIDQRGQVELLRTYFKDQYHREGTKFLVMRLLPRGHILKGSKTRSCPTKKIWKLDYLSAAIVRRRSSLENVIVGKGEDLYAVRTLLEWGIIGSGYDPERDKS